MSQPTPCYHCGLPVPAGGTFHADVLGQTRDFCCPGCQAVAQAIVAGGLQSYYQHRSDTAINPRELPQVLGEEMALYDRPDVQQPFVSHDAELASTALHIEGISCAACGWLIERHLRSLDGVGEASLNLSNHRLRVSWDDSRLPLSELLGQLRRIGYAAHPYQPDQAAARIARENRRAMRQLGAAGLLWMQVMMATMATWPEFNLDLSAGMASILRWTALLLTTPIVFYCCSDFFRGALRDLRTRHLSMDVSVSLAIGGAYLAGIWSTLTGQGELYFDAVGMFALFLLAGRYLERRARERTAAASAQLVNLLPASCLRLDEHGQNSRVLLSELNTGDHVLVQPGALVPADGEILEGQSSIDESVLTGEYLPLPRSVGDAVTAGTLNVESPLVIRVRALGDDTRLSAIVRLLERAQAEKPRLAELADKVAQWFLLVVLLAAAVVGLVWWQIDPQRAFWIVLALLVATCPCALSLATPTALTTATGTLHKLGLLLTRGHVLEGLNHIDTVVFDKTGTLTEGRLTLSAIQPLGELDADTCLGLAAALENRSEHPIAKAFGRAPEAADSVESHPGLGLSGNLGGRALRIGQPAFVAAGYAGTAPPIPGAQGQWLLLGDQQGPLAWLVLDDRLRGDAPALLEACRRQGWHTVLLSGDSSPMVGQIAAQLGMDEAVGGLTPDAKLQHLQALQARGQRVLMLGDGVNDVPVLAAADISIAMGSATDLAKTSADAVLLSNRLDSLVQTFSIARRSRRIIIENLLWAGLYNGLVLPFAALGWVTPLWAALGMSLSSLLVVLNALRLTRH
ncbi:heavy metal translocating P-type ATPase [Stutzerimonas kirkiae]|uniref:Cadmium-translocating P-type ATPase n=1 Tax=Stutzerimonas kirkiae TaxID=2211392 RepID=A0A4Q9R3Z7_9GAMM|nr:heavy metal translocating P-type ATPase [Stutzerimonas kirkiae]TBU93517.1 cadmium-translocating P-type ATPase [Stutzerimonas kirkiae]TBV01723.1 cadmium-translocating P-type ATPase [Stutzerimonas kirkiae]TBV07421.1 cadmium-translocating P-type ATPase [Stutzerimonas kirkiae]